MFFGFAKCVYGQALCMYKSKAVSVQKVKKKNQDYHKNTLLLVIFTNGSYFIPLA